MTNELAHAIGTALKPVLQRLAALEKNSHPPLDVQAIVREELAALRDPAIATEARRAETENTGSVHEGAGPQDIAQ